MRRLARRILPLVVVALILALAGWATFGAREASAATAFESQYTFEQTYGAALRLVRVDLGLKVTEKDPENGYVLFEYKSPESGGRVSNGSIEVVKGRDRNHV